MFAFFFMWYIIYPAPNIEKTIVFSLYFLGIFVENLLIVNSEIYFGVSQFYSIDLSIFMPVPFIGNIYYANNVICFEIKSYNPSNFVSFQDCFVYSFWIFI